jgi:hypothetical protein
MRATCPAHLILLDLITLIICGEADKLCNVLQPCANSSLRGLNIFVTALFSNILDFNSVYKFHLRL